MSAHGGRRAPVTALSWSGRRRSTAFAQGTRCTASSLGSGGTQGLQIDRFSVFLISLPHELRIICGLGSTLSITPGGKWGSSHSRNPQALHKVLAPSGPLLHSGVSRMLHEWHFPGGEALYSETGKRDRRDRITENLRFVSCTLSSGDQRSNHRQTKLSYS